MSKKLTEHIQILIAGRWKGKDRCLSCRGLKAVLPTSTPKWLYRILQRLSTYLWADMQTWGEKMCVCAWWLPFNRVLSN